MKKLIVAAVAAAVALPIAATADATLYGKIHVAVGSYDGDQGSPSNDGDLNFSDNASRVGIKGSEDLGGGMKAVYNVEFGMDMDDNSEGGPALSGRHAYVGLGGGFGTVLLGELSSPRKSVSQMANLFTDRMGDIRGLSKANDEGYVPNVIAYASPKMGGLSVTAAYSTDAAHMVVGSQAINDNNDLAVWSGNVMYSNGGVKVGLGYTDHMDANVATAKDSSTSLAASMKMGSAKVVAQYTMNSGTANNTDSAHYSLGGTYTMGANTLLAQYTASDNDGANNDADQLTVGVDHMMSKRTTVYAQYSMVDNESGSGAQAWNKTGVVVGQTAGGDSSGFAVGLIHKF